MTGPDRHPSVESPTLLAATRVRRVQQLATREQLADGLFAVGFLAAAVLLAVVFGSGEPVNLAVAAAFVAAFAITERVEFHIGTGYTTPIQLVFVPMLFALPPEVVPLFVGLGYVLAKLPRIIKGQLGTDRWLVALADSWFAIAPALVIAVASPGTPDWGDWPIFALAFGAQFAVDALISSIRAWACIGVKPLRVLLEVLWIYRFDALLIPIGLLAAVAAAQEPFGGLLVMPLVFLFAVLGREREVRIDKQLELERAYRGTALLLGDVIEDDDAYTGEHTRGVVGLALAVGRELELDEESLRDCEFGALLHDVGKVRMPKSIVNKKGPLDDEEWAIVRTHTIEGQRMLAKVGGVLGRVGEVVRGSHERWDGTGYPDGLRTDQIPLAARVISVCDAYNAMTTNRSYRRALPADVAIGEIEACAGTQFDPRVVQALVRVLSVRGHAVEVPDPHPQAVSLRLAETVRYQDALAEALAAREKDVASVGRPGGAHIAIRHL